MIAEPLGAVMIAEPLRWTCLPKSGATRTAAAIIATSMAASLLRMYSILCSAWQAGKQPLRDVAELDRVCERAQLLEALVLDLADSLTRHVERPADLVERARMLTVESVAELEHLALTARERPEDLAQCLLAHRDLCFLVRQRQVFVGDEVAEFRFVLVADRLLEGDGRLSAAPDVLDLLAREIEVAADLHGSRLAPELGAKLPL